MFRIRAGPGKAVRISPTLSLSGIAQVTSASLFTLALNFRPKAETTLRMVSKLGLCSPDQAL